MDKKIPVAKTTSEYIRRFPAPVQKKLKELRKAIQEVAPLAEEKISYQMPAFFLNGALVYFAGYAKHIGFYPGAQGILEFKEEISIYKNAKGSVQFPLEQPLPIKLIKKIVKFRLQQNLAKNGTWKATARKKKS